jgi:hypothetical protein
VSTIPREDQIAAPHKIRAAIMIIAGFAMGFISGPNVSGAVTSSAVDIHSLFT